MLEAVSLELRKLVLESMIRTKSVSECPDAVGGGQPRGLKVAATSTSGSWGGGLVSLAGVSERITVASDVVKCSSSINSSCGSSRACTSYLDAVLSAPARAPAAALVARCSAPSSSAVGLCMHAHGSLVA